MNAETTKVENLVLEHLRYIRGSLDRVADDVRELKSRVGHLEEQIAGLYGMYASLSTRLDKVENRLERVEKRLELAA